MRRINMGKLIVNYESYQEKYSSNQLEKLLMGKLGEFETLELTSDDYNLMFQHFLSKEGVTSLEFKDMVFKNLKLRGREDLVFENCTFEGNLDLEDFSHLSFCDCFVFCNDWFDHTLLLLADQINIEDSYMEFHDGTLMATGAISFLNSRVERDDSGTSITLMSPCLYWNDSKIQSDNLTWDVEKTIGTLKEEELYACDIRYLDIPLRIDGKSFGMLLNSTQQEEEALTKFVSYCQLVGITKFLEKKGSQLVSRLQTKEEAREYQNHLQGVDETNLKEVFSALEQPCSFSKTSELEKETIPQLVKRLKREN